ncbi:MAG: protein-glutamate O-methyltransferase CheR [Lachnospiraceae bacterium]|nr:protein-glutamate O-methyltransferase CheR [Lachnospiraceae bacterium]
MGNYELFKKQIKGLIGIDLNYYKEQQMKRRIESLIRKNACNSYEAYFAKLTSNKRLLEEFVSFLTINVTEFYRNPEQWQIFEDRIVPYLLNKFGKIINIWSAACSTGEEPYTVAMILSKYIPTNLINIYATDIDERVLEIAKNGIYSDKQVKNVPGDILNDNFMRTANNSLKISESIKKCVHYEKHDLLKDKYPEDMHLIICRNMMIYLTQDAKIDMYRNFRDSLVKDGLLFIGSTENIIRPQQFGFDNQTTFFYKKK